MRIAVISDTHDAFPSSLPKRLSKADEIWHLGDVVSEEILVEVESAGPPVRLVAGNCDLQGNWPGSLTLEREGLRCHLVHIPPHKAPTGVHLLLHGHTHIPKDAVDPFGVRWFNPGSVSLPRGGFPPTFAWLELKDGVIRRWTLEEV